MLCDKCHKNQTTKPLKACDFCNRLEFSEDILCWVTRKGSEDESLSECGAFRPSLTLVSSKEDDFTSIKIKDSEPSDLTDKDKWLGAYLKQQSQMNPDEVQFKLHYHVCLVSKKRHKVFLYPDEYVEKLNPIFQRIGDDFENTLIELFWISADHIHLSINTTPDYSLDEIVVKLITDSAKEIQLNYPEVVINNDAIWEAGYFAETIG